MMQTHRVEDFQQNVRPASNLNWLDSEILSDSTHLLRLTVVLQKGNTLKQQKKKWN